MIINQQLKFDSVSSAKMLSVSKLPAQQILDDMARFKTAQLPSLAMPPQEEDHQLNRLTNRLRNGY